MAGPVSREELEALAVRWADPDVSAEALGESGGVEAVIKMLGINVAKGLSAEQVSAMRERYGSNKIPEKKRRSFFEHLVEAFEDETLLILVAAAALALVNAVFVSDDSGDMIEAMSILAAVVIVSGVASTLNYAQDGEFQALKQLELETVIVTRDGVQTRVLRDELVVGDCFEVRAGSKLPADALLLPSATAQGLTVDESSATGESRASHKGPGALLLLAGTRVQEGAGRAVAFGVGVSSTYGRQLAKSQGGEDDDGPTPLQERLDVLAKLIGWFGLVAAIATSTALAVIALAGDTSKLTDVSFWLGDMLQFAVVGVTNVVVAVPEGLPLAVTISLAFSSSAMVADKILVRKLQACETMGSATVICSDKTGTLTENKMAVVAGRIAATPFLARGESEHSLACPACDASDLTARISSMAQDAAGRAIIFNTSAELGRDSVPAGSGGGAADQDPKRGGGMAWLGNPSECAMLAFLDEELGQRAAQVRTSVSLGQPAAAPAAAPAAGPAAGGASADSPLGMLYRRQFSSVTKSMATAVALPEAVGAGSWLYFKGAFEVVVGLCDTELQADGSSKRLDRAAVLREFEPAVHAALRTIAVARRRVHSCPATAAEWLALEEEGGMELVAVLGIRDPLRREVPGAVAKCQGAGIRVIMVTGDHIDTATAIARNCGILPAATADRAAPPAGTVMLGRDFAALQDDPAALRDAARSLRVLARSSPDDKHLLVDTLRKDDEVVAATGDGTNDGPALKHANVGLAMGITGTDVAKGASDVIILDDNFASICQAVVWGRSVQSNVRKFLQFQVTVNIVALVLSFAAACSLGSGDAGSADAGAMQERLARQLPLNSQQMLFCNLLMDSLAALALATEPPSEALLSRPPERKGSALITGTMWKHIGGQAVLQLIVLVVMFLHPSAYAWMSVEEFRSVEHRTVIFNVFILMNLLNLPFARKVRDEVNVLEGIHRSTLFVLIWAGVAAAQFGLVQYGGSYFGTSPLNAEQWFNCIAVASITVPVGIALRFVPAPAGTDAAVKPKLD